MKEILDVRGENCPEPVIKVARALDSARKGYILFVLTDNKECVEYIKDLVSVTKIGNLEIKERSNYYELKIIVE